VCVLYLEKNNTFGETEMFEENSERRATKTANKGGQNNSSKFLLSFSVPRLSLEAVVSRRVCDITRDDRESARAFYIYTLNTIYLSRRERQRIKSDDDDDDDASSSFSRPRSLFLVYGE